MAPCGCCVTRFEDAGASLAGAHAFTGTRMDSPTADPFALDPQCNQVVPDGSDVDVEILRDLPEATLWILRGDSPPPFFPLELGRVAHRREVTEDGRVFEVDTATNGARAESFAMQSCHSQATALDLIMASFTAT